MSFETEDRLMTAAMIMLLVGAAMAFLGLGVLAIRAAFGEFGSVGKADGREAVESAAAGKDRMAAGLDGTDGNGIVGPSKEIRFKGTSTDAQLDHREGDVSDVRHDHLAVVTPSTDPGNHGRLRDVPKLLPTNGTPGEASRDYGAESSKSCAARHDPLDKRVFHGGDYSKSER